MADARPPRSWFGFCLLVTVAAVGAMFFLGWLRSSEIDGNPAIQLNTTEIERDSKKLLGKGRELVEGATQGIRGEMDERTRQLP